MDGHKLKLFNSIKETLKNWQNEDGEIEVDNGNIDSLLDDIASDIDCTIPVYETKDIKLGDITHLIRTYQSIKVKNDDNGEEFYPSYMGLIDYKDYYVTEISSKDEMLIIDIKSQI